MHVVIIFVYAIYGHTHMNLTPERIHGDLCTIDRLDRQTPKANGNPPKKQPNG